MGSATHLTSSIGRWSTRHPWRAILVWVVAVVAAAGIGSLVGTRQLTAGEQMSGEAGRADRTIEKAFPQRVTEFVLVSNPKLFARDEAFRATLQDVVGRVTSTGVAAELHSPLEAGGGGLVSRDGHSALVQFHLAGDIEQAKDRLEPLDVAVAAAQDAHPGYRIEQTGDASINRAYDDTILKDFRRAEQLSIPITLLVLLFAFGALVAALLPLALALTAIVGGFGLLALRQPPLAGRARSRAR